MTAMMVLLMAGAFVFTNLMAVSKLPFLLGDLVVGLGVSRYVIIAILSVIYIMLGMVTDIVSCMLITIPILFPVVKALGFDPIWYGVMMVTLIEIGFITPPIGINVFMFSGVTGIPLGTIFRGIWPFVVAILVFVVIMIIFPQIATFLPSTM